MLKKIVWYLKKKKTTSIKFLLNTSDLFDHKSENAVSIKISFKQQSLIL